MSNIISPTRLIQIDNLFTLKGWDNNEEQERLLERYTSRISLFDEKGQDLFIELTGKFDNYAFSDILKALKNSYNKIDKRTLDNYNKIYFLSLTIPILKESRVLRKSKYGLINFLYKKYDIRKNVLYEKPKVKSGDIIKKIFEIEPTSLYKFKDFIFVEEYLKFKRLNLNSKSNNLIILLDDFIGTGETASEVLEFYRDEGFSLDNIIILSIVSLQEGINLIKEKYNVNIVCDKIQYKAIDENKLSIDKEVAKEIIYEMSKKVKIKNDHFGYKESQALVCILNKSPNNTLPIFWHETKDTLAPFPRKKIANK